MWWVVVVVVTVVVFLRVGRPRTEETSETRNVVRLLRCSVLLGGSWLANAAGRPVLLSWFVIMFLLACGVLCASFFVVVVRCRCRINSTMVYNTAAMTVCCVDKTHYYLSLLFFGGRSRQPEEYYTTVQSILLVPKKSTQSRCCCLILWTVRILSILTRPAVLFLNRVGTGQNCGKTL